MAKKTEKRPKVTRKRKAVKKQRARGRPGASPHSVSINGTQATPPSLTIDFGESVVFTNNNSDTRLLEIFEDSNNYRPAMFVEIPGRHAVTLTGGPDDDCHPATCWYSVRIPGQPWASHHGKHQIKRGSNRIIINS
jgi:hypothetical protein